MDFLTDLQERGLVHQFSAPSVEAWPRLPQRLAQGPITAYIGFDPTAASLHVGSLLQILNLVRLQRAGHRPIAIVGGGTGLIGDPSGKATERSMLTLSQLDENLQGIRAQLERFLDFSGPNGALLINNADWLCGLNLVDFLRDVGKFFSVNQMISRDSVRQRLEGREQGISYTEFSYGLLQAYDFLVLLDRHGCELQLGGSDQWGNILDGTDLIRRVRNRPAWGLTAPLVVKSDGTKFGKTESGNVWLDPVLTRPYSFYQFWLNAEDSDVGRHLRFFTFLSLEEIAEVERSSAEHPERREAQRALAFEVTKMVHGEAAAAAARRASQVLFEGGDLQSLSAQELDDAFLELPHTKLERAKLGTREATLTALVAETGLESSRAKARTALQSRAVSLNGRTEESDRPLEAADLLGGRYAFLRRGKKTYHVVEVV
ncbi:MAG TPA: tyrosine--tRNA ligase [Thermoanaerobaculia bacterium]|nr:tyrosine--tRNA ligase [Thermoanaerobaculia bacterium]